MNPTSFLSLSFLSVFALTCSVSAGTINVVNEPKQALKIKIEFDADSSIFSQIDISADEYSSFQIPSIDLKGKKIYSLKGDSLTDGLQCQHLNIDKDYKVTLKKSNKGFSCVAQDITGNKS